MSSLEFEFPNHLIDAYVKGNIESPQMILAQTARLGSLAAKDLIAGEYTCKQLYLAVPSHLQIEERIVPSIHRAHKAYKIDASADPNPNASYGYDRDTQQFTYARIQASANEVTQRYLDRSTRFFIQSVLDDAELVDILSNLPASQDETPSRILQLDTLFTHPDFAAHRQAHSMYWDIADEAIGAIKDDLRIWRDLQRPNSESGYLEHRFKKNMLLQHIVDKYLSEINAGYPKIEAATGINTVGLDKR